MYSPLGAAFLAAGRDIVFLRSEYMRVQFLFWAVVCTDGVFLQFVVLIVESTVN